MANAHMWIIKPTADDMTIAWQGRRIAKLEQDLAALHEAVAWERELDSVLTWLVRTGRYPKDVAGREDLFNERECARAEVARLMGGGE